MQVHTKEILVPTYKPIPKSLVDTKSCEAEWDNFIRTNKDLVDAYLFYKLNLHKCRGSLRLLLEWDEQQIASQRKQP